jgi:3-isopropylmalate/(R)-2-methylmalate dehydratase small subunit
MKLTSRAVFLPPDNIDTDQIYPARFLTTTEKSNVSKHLFEDRPDLRITPGYPILVAGDNFGCGSSREHAVWALLEFGIKAIVSTSFADIFRQNAYKNGLLPITVDRATYSQLKPNLAMTVDLATQTLSIEAGPTVTFAIDSFSKTCLLDNLDALGYVLKHSAEISDFEERNP